LSASSANAKCRLPVASKMLLQLAMQDIGQLTDIERWRARGLTAYMRRVLPHNGCVGSRRMRRFDITEPPRGCEPTQTTRLGVTQKGTSDADVLAAHGASPGPDRNGQARLGGDGVQQGHLVRG
jgi:hypothetical protein